VDCGLASGGSSLQEHTRVGAASGHDGDCLPVGVVPPGTPLVDAHLIVDHDAASANHLELFINKVTSNIASLLIREPPKQAPAKVVLPRRSKRQAAQSLSRVPVSKRGEILVMRRLGLVTVGSSPNASAVKAYEDLYKPDASNVKALAAIFNNDVGTESCRQRRKRKLAS